MITLRHFPLRDEGRGVLEDIHPGLHPATPVYSNNSNHYHLTSSYASSRLTQPCYNTCHNNDVIQFTTSELSNPATHRRLVA